MAAATARTIAPSVSVESPDAGAPPPSPPPAAAASEAGSQHRHLRHRDGALADRRAGSRGRSGELLRHQRAGVGVHDRLPGPEPVHEPVLAGGAGGGVRADLHRAVAGGQEEGGVPAGLVAVLADPARARPADGPLHGDRGPGHAAVHRHAQRVGDRADRRAVPGAVPGRAAAQPHRAVRRDPAVLRRVLDPGAGSGALEHRDRRSDGDPARALPRAERRLLLRDRMAGGHGRAVRC